MSDAIILPILVGIVGLGAYIYLVWGLLRNIEDARRMGGRLVTPRVRKPVTKSVTKRDQMRPFRSHLAM